MLATPPWFAEGERTGRWVAASELAVGDPVRRSDGSTGVVQAVVTVAQMRAMYNLTVADAHTFFVGNQQWLVHNAKCPVDLYAFGNSTQPRAPRPSDVNLTDLDPTQIIPGQKPSSTNLPHGASTFGNPADAPLSGHYWKISEGSELPPGMGVMPDGSDMIPGSPQPPTHHTIYNTDDMSFGDFVQNFLNLPWNYVGKK